jgi:hypothetical protein
VPAAQKDSLGDLKLSGLWGEANDDRRSGPQNKGLKKERVTAFLRRTIEILSVTVGSVPMHLLQLVVGRQWNGNVGKVSVSMTK